MSTEPLRLAFVGCGGIAEAHWAGAQQHPDRLRVTAAVDTDPERAAAMAAKTGATAFTSLAAALDSDTVDAVDIMLPHHEHEATAVAAFVAGKHVLLEKPMSTTIDSCDRILAAARAAGTVFMVAEQAQYWPDAVAVRDLIQSGSLGELVTARAVFGGGAVGPLGDRPRPWRFDLAAAGGGLVIDGGAHWIRPLRMWLGEIDEVVGVLGRPVVDMEGESLARALLRFRSGVVAVLDVWQAGFDRRPREEFRVVGTKAEVVIASRSDGRVLLFDAETREGREVVKADGGRGAAFGHELADFAAAVLDGVPPAAGPEVSLGELRTALALYRSAASGRWEKVWS